MISALRSLNPMLEIIILSGLLENFEVSELAKTPHVEVVEKPFSSRKLLVTIHDALAGSN